MIKIGQRYRYTVPLILQNIGDCHHTIGAIFEDQYISSQPENNMQKADAKIGQRWYWDYGGKNKTILEIVRVDVKEVFAKVIEVRSFSIGCSCSDRVGDEVKLNFALSFLHYLEGQDAPELSEPLT
jgi:hypothetical protein